MRATGLVDARVLARVSLGLDARGLMLYCNISTRWNAVRFVRRHEAKRKEEGYHGLVSLALGEM